MLELMYFSTKVIVSRLLNGDTKIIMESRVRTLRRLIERMYRAVAEKSQNQMEVIGEEGFTHEPNINHIHDL